MLKRTVITFHKVHNCLFEHILIRQSIEFNHWTKRDGDRSKPIFVAAIFRRDLTQRLDQTGQIDYVRDTMIYIFNIFAVELRGSRLLLRAGRLHSGV